MRKIAVMVVAGLALAGCATSSIQYIEPSPTTVPHRAVIDRPFDKVRIEYPKELAKSVFVVNNYTTDADLIFINASFSTDNPGEYIDCGISSRSWKGGVWTPEGSVTYDVADDVSFYTPVRGTSVFWKHHRTTRLDGRFNITLSPEGDTTVVTVNALYSAEATTQTQHEVQPHLRDTTRRTMTFRSGEVAGGGPDDPTCVSKGTLEQTLLSLVQ